MSCWPECVNQLHLVLLNRLAETARFEIIERQKLDQEATLHEFELILVDNFRPDEGVKNRRKLKSFWNSMEQNHEVRNDSDEPVFKPLYQWTFRQLLDFECTIFPELDREQRKKLKELANSYTIVDKTAVRNCLGLETPEREENESQVINFIFASGAEAIPSEIFQDIVACLDTHPTVKSFPSAFYTMMVVSGRRMVSFLFFFIMLLVSMILIPHVSGRAHYAAIATTKHFIEADWLAGCPYGVLSPLGCNFVQKNFHTIEYVEQDALRYFRNELIARLWPSPGATAADAPFGYHNFPPVGPVGSTFLIGALVLRLVPAPGTNAAHISCQTNNLSMPILESRLPGSFGCNALWSITIPFNVTREVAMQMASNSHIQIPVQRNSALVAQWPSFQPSSGIMVYSRLTLTLPEGGGVIRKMEVKPIDFGAHKYVLVMLIFCAVNFFQRVLMATYYVSQGFKFFTLDVTTDFLLLCMVCTAYGLLKNLPMMDALYQVDYVAVQADKIEYLYTVAMYIMGWWIIFAVVFIIRYFRDVVGIKLVIAIVQHAAYKIFSLLVVFGVWTVTFVYVAQLLFAGVDPMLASSFGAFQFVFKFFSGGSDRYDQLFQMHPIWGPVFWFVLTIFSAFFALNLLIAVLTAPLAEVKTMADLHIHVANAVEEDLASEEGSARFWWQWKAWSFSFVNLVTDMDPTPINKLHWTRLCHSIHVLTHERDNPSKIIDAVEEFYELVCNEHSKVKYETPFVAKVREMEAMDMVSFTFVVHAIASLTPNDLIRDARLSKALAKYDAFTTKMDDLITLQNERRLKARRLSTLSEETKRLLVPRKSLRIEANFNFTKYLKGRVTLARWAVVWLLIAVFLFIMFLSRGLQYPKHSSRLTKALHDGLKNREIKEECYDAACKTAFSFTKTFMDTGDLADWYVWVSTVLGRQLWLRDSLEGNIPPKNRVWWDNRTYFDVPIYFRQLRAKPRQCDFGTLATTGAYSGTKYADRLNHLRQSFHCFGDSNSDFDKSPLHYPSTGLPVGISAEAYRWQSNCPERRDSRHYGVLRDYPCEGYSVAMHNLTSLQALMDAAWFDNATRLIAFTGTFHSGRAAVEYTLFLEMGEGGGFSHPHVFSTSLEEDHDALVGDLYIMMGIMSLELLPFFYQFAVWCWRRIHAKKHEQSEMTLMFPARWLILLYVFVLIVPYIIYRTRTVNERIKFQLVIASFGGTYMVTRRFLFPLAGLLSKEGTLLFDTLVNAAIQCTYVIPFYLILILALAHGGMLLFGSNVSAFASPRYAIAIVFRGALGDWDSSEIISAAPEMALLFSLVFFIIVLIMLANLVLAMVTSAEGDTIAVSDYVALSVAICRRRQWHIMYGELYEFLLAWDIWSEKNKKIQAAGQYRCLPVLCVKEQRLLFPTESLITVLGPHRTNDVLSALHLDSISEVSFRSAVTYILEAYEKFKKQNPVEEAIDARREAFELDAFWKAEEKCVAETKTASDSGKEEEEEEANQLLSPTMSFKSLPQNHFVLPHDRRDVIVKLCEGSDHKDWYFDERSNFYWSHGEQLYFDPASENFYNPHTAEWYNPETNEWFTLQHHGDSGED